MTVESRSHTGCWTCRLRKRKCDEKKPACSQCASLGLHCHGHGAKPAWMDGGSKQKSQLERVKQQVAHATRRRRIDRIHERYEASSTLPPSKPTV
ncbi:hypothetical protein F5884DRAFT_806008, partial [Xylogone sp. PMI_703]